MYRQIVPCSGASLFMVYRTRFRHSKGSPFDLHQLPRYSREFAKEPSLRLDWTPPRDTLYTAKRYQGVNPYKRGREDKSTREAAIIFRRAVSLHSLEEAVAHVTFAYFKSSLSNNGEFVMASVQPSVQRRGSCCFGQTRSVRLRSNGAT